MLFQDITRRGANALKEQQEQERQQELARQKAEQERQQELARQQEEAERKRNEKVEEEKRKQMMTTTTTATTTTTTASKLTTLPPEVQKAIDEILSSLQKIPKDKIPTSPPHPTLSLILDIEPTKADDIYAYMNKESIKRINNEISDLISSANGNIDMSLKKQLEFLTNHLNKLLSFASSFKH